MTVPIRVGRSVRWGGSLIGVGVLQFVAVNLAVQLQYPGYSLLQNYISDLGNTATSPWHTVFNVSIALLGVLAFAGICLGWGGFPRGASRLVGLLLLLVASVAAVLVGAFPENVNPGVHGTVSLLVFLPGGLGLVVLGSGMRSSAAWSGLRIPTILLGIVTLVSLAYYAPTQTSNSTWDPGLIERLIVAPILIWGFATAVRLATLPRLGRVAASIPV